jgi:hypothetical protein
MCAPSPPLPRPGPPPSPSRFDSNSGANAQDAELDSPTAASIIESQLVRREGSMHLPRPADCNVQGTHSDMCIVRVRRNHLVEDALDEIARQYRCGVCLLALVCVWCVCVCVCLVCVWGLCVWWVGLGQVMKGHRCEEGLKEARGGGWGRGERVGGHKSEVLLA